MSSSDDAKEIIKTLALRRDNAPIILSGFIVAMLTLLLVILTIPSIFKLKNPIYAVVMGVLLFIDIFFICIGFLRFYRKDVAIRNKINEASKQHNLKEFYVGIFPEEQKISTARVRQAGVLLVVRKIFGVFLIIVGGYIVWKGYVLLNNFYSSLPSSMTGLNIIIVPLETTIFYMGGLLLAILGLFMFLGKDKVLNWAQKIKLPNL